MKDAKGRGGSTPNRFEREVAVLVKNGVSKSKAEQIVQGRAEFLMQQGLGYQPSATMKSEGNSTGGGGRSAASRKKATGTPTSKSINSLVIKKK